MALRLSPKWIQSFCQIQATPEELADMLSQSGLETEVIEDVVIDPKIVIGEIVSVKPHPNATKLNVCEVNIGSRKPLNIVCGCPTVGSAKRVIVAPIGSKLPGLEIQKVSLRGIESEGMICALNELGLAESGKGIYHVHEDVPKGTSLVKWLQHDEKLLEIDVTPNRGDCLSVYGIARDLSASQNKPLAPYPKGIDLSKVKKAHLLDIKTEACPAYAAMELDINRDKKPPLYMLNRLRQAGMGSNHLVVDVLNYIMLEIGQPMHGFDRDTLQGPLVIKDKTKKACALLDGSTYEPKSWDIMVCDQKAPHALAGIMGGYDSRLQAHSEHVQLESALFMPERIAKSLRRCTLNTDASYRYERGVSLDLNEIALSYAARLLVEYADAKILTKHLEKRELPLRKVELDPDFINDYLGIDLDTKTMKSMLTRLGMSISGQMVTIPPYRYDMSISEDLVEEIARLYGYNNIPLSEMKDTLVPKVIHQDPHHMTKVGLTHLGFSEVIQFSFVSKKLLDIFSVKTTPIEIQNPIHAEYGYMRTHLWQSLILALQYNQQRQKQHVKLFEVGSVFHLNGKTIEEPNHIAALVMGQVNQGYQASKKTVDYYTMQSVVLHILSQYDAKDITFKPSKHPALHPNQSADIFLSGKPIGTLGMLHPEVALELDLPEVGLCDINLDVLSIKSIEKAKKPSKYPAIHRDITLTVPKDVSVQSLESKVQNIPHMVSMTLLDIYSSDDKTQNITWSIQFQSDQKTLSDKAVDTAMQILLSALKS